MTTQENKSSSQLVYLFGTDSVHWKYEPGYLMYATPNIISDQLIKSANEQFILHQRIVWDMFAGIGTDAIKFSFKAGRVICTELNETTFGHLQENVEHFKKKDNIEIYNIDCCQFMNQDDIDLVYFDPPWGDSFKSGVPFQFNEVILANGTNVVDLAREMHKKYPMIIKSPISSDTFEQEFNDDIIRVQTYTQQKLKFIFVSKATN